MKEIKVKMPIDMLATLDQQAQELNITRSELIRRRVQGNRMSVTGYQRLCHEARRHVGNLFPARHVESLVAFTLHRYLAHEAESIPSPSSPPASAL